MILTAALVEGAALFAIIVGFLAMVLIIIHRNKNLLHPMHRAEDAVFNISNEIQINLKFEF